MTVHYTREGPVAWLTIDRPEARNALSAAVRAGLWDGVRRFVADDAAVLVLTGAGDRAFCAGGDLKEMADAALEVPPPDFLPQFGRNIDVPKPTIAAVNGVAYAGGFLLAQQCDLVVAAEHAAFAVTEVRVGRGAPWAAPLPWLVGPRAAAEILLTGEPVERGAGVRDRAGQPGGARPPSCTSGRRSWPSGSPPTRRCRWRRRNARCTCRRPRRRPTRSGRRSTARPTHKRGRVPSGRSATPVWKGR